MIDANQASQWLKWQSASPLKKFLFWRRPPPNRQHYPHDIDVLTACQLTARGLHCGGGSLLEHGLRCESTARHSFRTRVQITQGSWRARRYCFRLRLRKHSALFVAGHKPPCQQTKARGSALFPRIFLMYFGNPLPFFHILFIIFWTSFFSQNRQSETVYKLWQAWAVGCFFLSLRVDV